MKNLNKLVAIVVGVLLSLPVLAEDWYVDKFEVPFVECTFENGLPMKFSQLGIYANYGIIIGSKTPEGRRSVFGSEMEIRNGPVGNAEEDTTFILRSDGNDDMIAVLNVEWVRGLEPIVNLELWSGPTQVFNENCNSKAVQVYIDKPSAR